jgi:hypothetical protein
MQSARGANVAAKKAQTKDFADFDFGDLGGFSDNFDPGVMGDPSAYGLGGIDWSQIIGQQPENGSFVGPDGSDPNGFTPGDYNELDQFNAGLGDPSDPSGGGGGSTLSSLARLLTGGSGGGSALGALGQLLPFLATLGGGLMSRNATQDATHQVQDSLANANNQVTSLLGGAGSGFKPYQDAGLSALGKMQAFPQSNLAGNFKPLGSGRGINLAQLAKG